MKRQKTDEFFEILGSRQVHSSNTDLGETELPHPHTLEERVSVLEYAIERIEKQCDKQCCCKQ